jgi:hypothetical protein
MYQAVFQRYEKKYLITAGQYAALRERWEGRLERDREGEYGVFNLYYDTCRYDLARSSAGKPVYKEKLRMRSYGKAGAGRPVFLELKKKFRGVVYKRRARLPSYEGAAAFMAGGLCLYEEWGEGQVLTEIRRFADRYPGLEAKVFLAYDREAYGGVDDPGLRLTFDTNIRFRRGCLRLDRDDACGNLLEPGRVLLEVKSPGAIPLWLCRALSDCGAFPTGFSKYGDCYRRFLRGAAAVPGGETGEIMESNFNEWRETTSA